MKSAGILASERRAVIYPETCLPNGLGAPDIPFEIIDESATPAQLGRLVKAILKQSTIDDPPRRRYVDRREKLFKLAGIKGSRRAIVGITDDNDYRVIEFMPCQRDGVGHSGVPEERLEVPRNCSMTELGSALLKAIVTARRLAQA